MPDPTAVKARPFLRDVDFLTPKECQRASADVHELRNRWEPRNPRGPFFTLGAASYLDAAAPRSSGFYRSKAAALNPVLLERFGWLYDRLSQAIAAALEAPVVYDDRFGRPGFHVFLAHPIFTQPVASVHIDLQYQLVDWQTAPDQRPDFSNPLSFTVPVWMPRAGAGLNVWDIAIGEFHNRPYLEALAARSPSRYHPYRLGQLFLHSGHMVHQIARTRQLEPGAPEDARITLQGHAIRCGDEWRLYW